jgi:predicted DNA-binding transcriptional regulator AlpA
MHDHREGEAMPDDMPNLLDITEVCTFFGGLDPSTIYRGIGVGRYPRPVRVGANTSRWLRSECEQALAGMIAGRAQQ